MHRGGNRPAGADEIGAAAATSPVDSLDILGIRVAAVDRPGALTRIGRWVDGGETRCVSLATAHGVMDARRSPRVQLAFAAADLVVPDGMSMVWLLRLAGYRGVGRVYGPDLMLELCRISPARGWSHFLLGGDEAVNEQLAHRLRESHPGIRIAGRWSPPFRPLSRREDEAIVRRIDDSGAGLVWVGLGTPRQDLWMAAHGRRLRGAVSIGVGAAFDFLAGAKRQAPRWIQRSGFEWLFRFASEPRRLWPRYSRYPLFGLLALDRLPAMRRECRRPNR